MCIIDACAEPQIHAIRSIYYARVYVRDGSYDARNQRTMPFHLSVLTLKIRFKSMFLRELLMLTLTVCVNCQPTLEPPTGHFCPEVNVTYTCRDSLVTAMTWFAEPYFSGNQGIKYAPVSITNETMKKGDYFHVISSVFRGPANVRLDKPLISLQLWVCYLPTDFHCCLKLIMYNTSLSVNISAHNCAGYSDPFSLVLQYDKG